MLGFGLGRNVDMRISAKEDYALRAALELAIADGGPLKREEIAQATSPATSSLPASRRSFPAPTTGSDAALPAGQRCSGFGDRRAFARAG